MLLGPFNSFLINDILFALKKNEIKHEIIQDPVALEKIRTLDLQKNPSVNTGLYSSSGDFLYIQIEDNDALRVESLLEKHGIVLATTSEDTEVLSTAEYHCRICDYTSDHPITCPAHGQPLLEYSEWVDATRTNDSVFVRYMFVGILVLAGCVFAYLNYFSKNS
jgi:hypothetical protein